MNRQHALRQLSQVKSELQRRFGIKRLALFGSTARDEARDDSDVDVIGAR